MYENVQQAAAEQNCCSLNLKYNQGSDKFMMVCAIEAVIRTELLHHQFQGPFLGRQITASSRA